MVCILFDCAPDDVDCANIYQNPHGDVTELNWRAFNWGQRVERLIGDLASQRATLTNLNRQGLDIFITLNKSDGLGISSQNINGITALFADLDGAPLANIESFPFEPTIINETSPGKYHAIYKVEGLPKSEFARCQRAIAVAIGSDQSVNDLARVIRVPGFFIIKFKRSNFYRAWFTSAQMPFAPAPTLLLVGKHQMSNS